MTRIEVRRLARWGSRHEKWFPSEASALAYIEDQINGRGIVGGSYKRIDNVYYYSPHPVDD